MDLYIKAKPGSRRDLITRMDENHWVVEMTTLPEDGKANAKIIELVAKDLRIAKGRIFILRGLKSKNKVLEIR